MALSGGQRRGEIGFGRFLRNPAVTVAGLGEGAAQHTSARVAGREVLAIQDTSEIILGGRKKRDQGYGPVGKGGNLGGVLLHPVLAVDAASGALFGLADIAVWNREGVRTVSHRQRVAGDKESDRWLVGIRQAGEVLRTAAEITVVADRESDIYQDFALRPAAVHLLVRSGFDRRLAGGDKLFDHADRLNEATRFDVMLPAAPGRPARKATLALRFGPVTLLRPQSGQTAAARAVLPDSVSLSLVDISEVDAPSGTPGVHWRLLTSHRVDDVGMARKMLDFYRKRWIIEEYFRTLKTAGFHIEEAEISDPHVMVKLVALAAIAAVTVTQLVRARDNPCDQALADAFDPGDAPLIAALCRDFEGKNPTKRQTNPHPGATLAFATWVIARLGGWTGYYGKPGPLTLSRGLQKFQAIKYGARIARTNV